MNRFALALVKGQIVGSLEHDDDLCRSSNESSKKTGLKEDIDLRSLSMAKKIMSPGLPKIKLQFYISPLKIIPTALCHRIVG